MHFLFKHDSIKFTVDKLKKKVLEWLSVNFMTNIIKRWSGVHPKNIRRNKSDKIVIKTCY